VRSPLRRAGSRRPVASLLLLTTIGLIAAVAGPDAVAAHALLRSSDPASGATLGTAPSSVRLTFTETPDLRLTSVKVLDSSGVDHVGGSLQALTDPPDSIEVPLEALPDGVFTVTWRTVSAVDGHIAAGTFAFGVGITPPPGQPTQGTGGTSESGSAGAIAVRWLLYLGLLGLIGAAFVAVAVARQPTPELVPMAAAGWVVSAIGMIGVVGVQWVEVGAPIEQLPSSSIGAAALLRILALALIALSLAGLAVAPVLRGRRGWSIVGITAALALGVDVALGHAAAGPDWPLQVGSQWLHGFASAVWMGGLAGLLLVLPSTPPGDRLATARRFSFWAGIALAIVIATGVIRAIAEIGTLDALFTTDFGRVVLGKSVVLLGLASLGAFNRFVNLRAPARVPGGLRRVGGAELSLALIVFGLSAWLVNLSPPTSAGGGQPPPAQPIVALGHDFGTSVKARLVVTPGAAGANAFDLALSDYDSGQPIDAAAASIRFQLVSQASVAPSTLELTSAGQGRFSGSGPNLSIDGIWQLTATVAPAAGTAVEVPLLVATVVPAEPVQELVSAGLPTLYTVQLGTQGSAQLYLDPGGPGQNQLHVTFFDPTGSELPTKLATIAVFPATGDAAVLPPRLLEPGHFVTTIETTAGALAVDVVSPLPADTGHLHVHVTIEVTP
jgi:copper transport protein